MYAIYCHYVCLESDEYLIIMNNMTTFCLTLNCFILYSNNIGIFINKRIFSQKISSLLFCN